MGCGHYFESLYSLKPIDEKTLNIIKEYLKTEKSEFRMDIDEYLNDKYYFSENKIILDSGIIYDAMEIMEFNINYRLLYFKTGENKYAEITFAILSILKEYYGNDVLFRTDISKFFLQDFIFPLKKLGYNIKFENAIEDDKNIEGLYEINCYKKNKNKNINTLCNVGIPKIDKKTYNIL